MKTAKRILIVALLLVMSLSIFVACQKGFTVTIVSAGTGVATQTVTCGQQIIENGDKLPEGTEIDVTWSAASNFNAWLYINDSKTTHTSPAKITINGDTKIEIKAERTDFTVSIVEKSAGVATQVVKVGTTEISTGARFQIGTVLTVTWTSATGYDTALFVNDVEKTTTSPASVTMEGNTKIEIKAVKKQYTVTIVGKPTGVATQTVKDGSTEISTGSKVEHGKQLTITWTASATYFKTELFINDVKTEGNGSVNITVTDNVKIEVKATLLQYTMTVVSRGTGVTTQSVKHGNTEVVTGSKINGGTSLTVTWAAASNYVAELYVNDVKQTATSPATIVVTSDTKIEIKSALKQFKVTIVKPADGLKSMSVRDITSEIVSGSSIIIHSTLTVSWETKVGFDAALFVNDTKVTSTSPADVTITAETKIEIKVEKLFDDVVDKQSGLNNSLLTGNYTGHFFGATGGVAVTTDASFPYELTRPTTADGLFTRVFKVSQLTGVAGDVQLLASDGGTDYWDVLNNWQALQQHEDDGVDASFINKIQALTGYSGYWGSVLGNKLQKYTSGTNTQKYTETLEFEFNASNSGIYLVTMDVYVLGTTNLEQKASYSILIFVHDDGAVTVEKGLPTLGDPSVLTGFFESTPDTVAGEVVVGNTNLSFINNIARPVDDDTVLTRVFKVERVDGKDIGNAMLLNYDPIDADSGYYVDVLSNWGSIQDFIGAGLGTTFFGPMLQLDGYGGYWGSINGDSLSKGTAGELMADVLNLRFVTDQVGVYLVTMDIYVLVNGSLELSCSQSIMVNVIAPTAS